MPFSYNPERDIPELVEKVILLTGGNSLLSQYRDPARVVTNPNQELPELAKKPSSNLPNTIPSTSTSLDVILKQPTQLSHHANLLQAKLPSFHVTRHHSAPSPKPPKYSSKSLKTSSIFSSAMLGSWLSHQDFRKMDTKSNSRSIISHTHYSSNFAYLLSSDPRKKRAMLVSYQ
jgi:hypothetical protein